MIFFIAIAVLIGAVLEIDSLFYYFISGSSVSFLYFLLKKEEQKNVNH